MKPTNPQPSSNALVALSLAAAMSCASSPGARAVATTSPPPISNQSDSRRPAATSVENAPRSEFSPDDPAGRTALFERLVAAARRYHVFATATENNFGHPWDDALPALRSEFIAGSTRPALLTALAHFGYSLRDLHCRYEIPDPRTRLGAGFDMRLAWTATGPFYFVAAVSNRGLVRRLEPGDVLVSLDGIASTQLAQHHALQSSSNHPRGRATDIARFISHRATLSTSTREGDVGRWVFTRKGVRDAIVIETTWRREPGPPSNWDDHFVDYAGTHCERLPDRSYPGYALSSVGGNYCLYTAPRGDARAYPIVRFHSFYYHSPTGPDADPRHLVRADHDALEAQLRAIGTVRGVILDLRDNGGGNNPNWFLDWFAPAPFHAGMVSMPLIADWQRDFADERALHAHIDSPTAPVSYSAMLANRTPGQRFSAAYPFMCSPTTCDEHNQVIPSHPVTAAPIALVVGPSCVSSCDQFARVFDENDFGPLVGEPTAAAYTPTRLRYEVSPDRSARLGAMMFAFAREQSGRTGDDLEGVPVHLDAPVDHLPDASDHYDARIVEAARTQFGSYRFMTHRIARRTR